LVALSDELSDQKCENKRLEKELTLIMDDMEEL